jgi:hypothetical protein
MGSVHGFGVKSGPQALVEGKTHLVLVEGTIEGKRRLLDPSKGLEGLPHLGFADFKGNAANIDPPQDLHGFQACRAFLLLRHLLTALGGNLA